MSSQLDSGFCSTIDSARNVQGSDNSDPETESSGSSNKSSESENEGRKPKSTADIYKSIQAKCHTESQKHSLNALKKLPIDKKIHNYRKKAPSQSICRKCGKRGHWSKKCPGKVQTIPPVRRANIERALKSCGYEEFLPMQAEIIKMIVKGLPMLVVLPRSSGKSLCYQLPAYLCHQKSKSISLVISPLISLMEDQIKQLPECIKGVCLHHEQTLSVREAALKAIMDKEVSIIMMTPEELMKRIYQSNLFNLCRFPPISLLCIDEVHCISEWQRPTYQRLPKVVRDKLVVKSILGLTATATHHTTYSLAAKLGIDKANVIHNFKMPSNLKITVSWEENRNQALVQLLQSPKIRQCKSIIIYCLTRADAENIADTLKDKLQHTMPKQRKKTEDSEEDPAELESRIEVGGAKGKQRKRKRGSEGQAVKKCKLDWSVECYHAGIPQSKKARIAADFMMGELRVVVTTTAFSMGINKDDVQAVIHYNIPRSVESYMQQISRAGRDESVAYCHVFITKEGDDVKQSSDYLCTTTPKKKAIRNLLRYLADIIQTKPKGQKAEKESHIGVDIPVVEVCGLLDDIPENGLQTILCCLEEVDGIEIEGPLTGKFIKIECHCKISERGAITTYTDLTFKLLKQQEQSMILKLEHLYKILKNVAHKSFEESFKHDQASIIKESIETYFTQDNAKDLSLQTISSLPSSSTDGLDLALRSMPGSSEAAAADHELGLADLSSIASKLQDIESHKKEIYKLGFELGISHARLTAMPDEMSYLNEMLHNWLIKVDGVVNRGIPSWRILVEALKAIQQVGIAKNIAKDMPGIKL